MGLYYYNSIGIRFKYVTKVSSNVITEDSTFIPDSGDSNRHSTKVLPEVLISQGLTTASKEGTNDELDRRHMGQDQQNTAAAAVVLQPSSSASASAAQVSTYRPHAIIVNVVQVNDTAESLFFKY